MFKIKNRFLSSLLQWLELQELEGKKNRERVRFINLLQERLKEVNSFFHSLIDKFVEKDEKGHYKIEENNGNQVFSFANKKEKGKYIKELNDLYDEEFKLDLTELNKEMLSVIKNIVLNTHDKFGPKKNDTPQQKAINIRVAYD